MSKPLDVHGGIVPLPFHTRWLPDTRNKVIILVEATEVNDKLITMFQTLMLDRVEAFIVLLKEQTTVPHVHALVSFITLTRTQVIEQLHKANPAKSFWYTHLKSLNPIHPAFWRILDTANHGTNYSYVDEKGNTYDLVSVTPVGESTTSIFTEQIAAYADFYEHPELNKVSLSSQLLQKTKFNISEITMDTSDSFTPLCHLASIYHSDKTPYNTFNHRHPYTAVYDTFFRPYTRKDFCKIGEVGVLNGASINMWVDYFPTAKIYGFDISKDCLQKMPSLNRVEGLIVDAGNPLALRMALSTACNDGKKFSILIEDASHHLNHQLLFLRDAVDFVEPGGLLVIEDIFRDIPLARFEEALAQVSDRVLNAVMVRTEHKFKFSPEWNNDRVLLVWVR